MITQHLKWNKENYQVLFLTDYKANTISYIFSKIYGITLNTGVRTQAAESISHGVIQKTHHDPIQSIVNYLIEKKVLITPDNI
jgi:hypothetical protein